MDQQLAQPFLESAIRIIREMAGFEIQPVSPFAGEGEEVASLGVASIISFSGKKKGRLLLTLQPELALALARKINQEDYQNPREHMVLATISEINNIVAGDANTSLNNAYQLGLRLAPPIVFTGQEALISLPKIPSVTAACHSEYGGLKINIAFEGGK